MKIHVRNEEGNLVPLEIVTLKGEKGAPGSKGKDGITPNISIGTVTTLEAGEEATVTNSGTKENPIFNFGIPKGESGANSSGSDNISINDVIIAKDKTWSSSKIEDFIHTNDDVIWSTAQKEDLSVEYTKEGYLREVEILGNTIQNQDDLSDIQHLGELYVDNKGKQCYKIDVNSYNQKTLLSKIKTRVRSSYGGKITQLTETTGSFSLSANNQNIIIDFFNSAELLGRDKWCYVVIRFNDAISAITFNSLTRGCKIVSNDTLIFNGLTYGGGNISSLEIKGDSGVTLNKIYNYEIIEFIATNKQSDFSLWDDYKSHKTTLLLPCQLMKVGDISDRLYWDSNKGRYVIEKNIYKYSFVELDIISKIQNDSATFHFGIDNVAMNPIFDDGSFAYHPIGICNKGLCRSPYYIHWDYHGKNVFGAGLNRNNKTISFAGRICRDEGVDDIVTAKQWIKDNDVYCYYRLQTPQLIDTDIREEIKLPTYKNNTYITVNGGIQGSIKAKAPIDGGKVIAVLQDKNTELEAINNIQDHMINTTLLATDEILSVLEPLLIDLLTNEKSYSKIAEMYAAMVKRGLKKEEDIPERYKEQVKEILNNSNSK